MDEKARKLERIKAIVEEWLKGSITSECGMRKITREFT